MKRPSIIVIGAGLAGCEAAWRAANMGVHVTLYEMKPVKFSPAHKNESMAELVCSNSLRAESTENASGILKREMELLGSIIIEAAHETRVPAGSALAVDRDWFSSVITERITGHPDVEVIRREVTELPAGTPVVLATGPLTSDDLAGQIINITGKENLFFYDAISPILTSESIDRTAAFMGSRYDKGGDDYINLPLTEEEYYRFIREVKRADEVLPRSFEDSRIFEGCLPIEVMVKRGDDTLAFGPMKPVGLIDPKTGQRPFAVVQLRHENREGTLFNMVGFQTRLKQKDQERIFRMIPGLENAQFARYGSIHRNTFINAPRIIFPTLEVRMRPGIFITGQLVGVEGYVESAAVGIVAGLNAALVALGEGPLVPPRSAAIGSLIAYITEARSGEFQPMNINFGLFTQPPPGVRKKDRKRYIANRALEEMRSWLEKIDGIEKQRHVYVGPS
jgi:methylenetetrahydrofolate--tRNA-(uracil-5-)-methyltransferase